MSRMPNGWEKRHLRDLLHIKHGFAFKGEHISTSGPYVLVTPGNFFEEGGFKRNGDKQKRYSGGVPSEYILQAGSLVVAMTEQAEGLLGSAAFVPDDETYLHNQRIGLVTSENTDIGFLYYLFNTPSVRQQIRGSSSGTKVRHTSPSRVGEATAWLPTLAVQSRIAHILSAYDGLIEVNQRRIAILEDMARRLFDEWFVRFRYPGHEAVPLAETELGWVPKGWKVSPLDALVSHSIGGTWGKEEPAVEVPVSASVIRGTDFSRLKSGSFDAVPQRYISLKHAQTRLLEPGDVLIEVSGGSKDQPVGRTLLLDEGVFANYNNVVTFASFCRRLRPASPDAAEYLDLQLEKIYLSREIMKFQKQSTGISNLSVTMLLEEKKIALPPSHTLKDFAALVSPINAFKGNLRNQIFRLKEARDLLLPKLISGEIDVSTAEETFSEAAE